jgi:hypothetical protein
MRYMCLVYGDDADVGSAVGSAPGLPGDSVLAYGDGGGVTTVRVEGDGVSVVDGAVPGSSERLRGFYVIDARDLNDAVRFAARVVAARPGLVEVRPAVGRSAGPAEGAPSTRNRALERFVGTWRTEGMLHEAGAGPGVPFAGTDTYEWLPGGFFLLHRWDAAMPDGPVTGVEVFGYDPAAAAFAAHAFDSDGGMVLMDGREDGDVWVFRGARNGQEVRFTGRFRKDGRVLAGAWERRFRGGSWQPWMDVVRTRVDPA